MRFHVKLQGRALAPFEVVMKRGAVLSALLLAAAAAYSAQSHAASADTAASEPTKSRAGMESITPSSIGAHSVLPTGYRRVEQVTRVPISTEELVALTAKGKQVELDPDTHERIIRSFVDHLPEGWLMESKGSAQVDSLGRPIVNTASGLPGWAQADVDALRAAIARQLASRAAAVRAGAGTFELDGILGNYIGQAIVRGVPFEDLASLSGTPETPGLSPDASQALIGYLHFYENEKFLHAGDFGYEYAPTAYAPEIVKFVEGHGNDLRHVLAIEVDPPSEGHRLISSCYDRVPFSRGMTALSGQTDIWVSNAFDDASADIPTGFPLFFFYDCADQDTNTSVRVSTNGFLTFFQQGGGTLDATHYLNTIIPDLTDADGFAAPWWDDLVVANGQGTPDRVSYKTEGGVGARVFIVEWFSMSRLGGSPSDFHYFQARIYEGSGVLELHTDASLWSADASDSATIGLENYAGTAGDCGPNCLNTNSVQAPNNYYFGAAPRPFNDTCDRGFFLYSGDVLTQVNLRNALPNGPTGCGNNFFNRDLYYQYQAICNGTLTFSACGTRDANGPNTGPDTVMSAYSACTGNSGNQIACVDDANAPGCNGLDSVLSVPVTNGQLVSLRVTNYGVDAGSFGNGRLNLSASFAASAPPSNDTCAGAAALPAGSAVPGTLSCASNDGSSTCGDQRPDTWYSFTAPSCGRLTVSMCGANAASGMDSVLSLHSGCPGNAGNEIACNDDGLEPGCSSVDARVSAELAAGQQVFIRATHLGQGIGTGGYVLKADFPGPPPAAVTLAGAKLFPSTARLTWGSVPGASRYDVVRGSLNALHNGGGNFTAAVTGCLANDLASNQVDDPGSPSAGTGLWYLARAVGCAGAGTYDGDGPGQVGLRDAEIAAAASACP